MINTRLKSLIPSATLRINEYSNHLEEQGKTIYKLGFGQSPFPVPQAMVNALKERAHEKAYLPVRGLYQLREIVAKYYQRTQRLSVKAENILISPGSKMYLFIAQLAHEGDLLLPAPSWVSYAPQAKIIGKKCHWLNTTEANSWRLMPDDLEDFCKKNPQPKMLLLNYPNNPTGVTYTAAQLKVLAQVARKYQIIILSDEIYGELHHDNQHVSIAQYYPEGTIIYSGLSKWAGAGGWRVGTTLVPHELKDLRNTMATIASETFTTVSSPIQYGSIAAFEDTTDLDNYRHAARKILKHVGNFTYQSLQNMNITTPRPEGGFYSFINFEAHRKNLAQKNIVDSVSFSNQLLEETGIALLPSIDFGRQAEELLFRMAFVDFDGEKALNAVLNTYSAKPLDDNFLKNYTPKIVTAMEKLAEWLN